MTNKKNQELAEALRWFADGLDMIDNDLFPVYNAEIIKLILLEYRNR